MLKSDLVQTDTHSIKILLRQENLRFLRRTNHNTKPLCLIINKVCNMNRFTSLCIIGFLVLSFSCSEKNYEKLKEDKTSNKFWNDSIAQNHYKNRNDSLTWDMETFYGDLSTISESIIDPINFGAFPNPDYNLLGENSFKGLGAGGTNKKIGDKTIQYTTFYVKKNDLNKADLGERKNDVFFNIIMLTDTLDTENHNLNSGVAISRNHPNYIGQGSLITKNNKIDFVAFETIDNHGYAIVNMRLFNLKFGNTILIAPQKDRSLRSLQLNIPNGEVEEIDSKIEDLLKKDIVYSFFTKSSNI